MEGHDAYDAYDAYSMGTEYRVCISKIDTLAA